MITSSARRYAVAAFGVAQESGELDAWQAALDRAASLLQDPSARLAFSSPAVNPESKRAALDQLVPVAPRTARNFLHILIERDRFATIATIAEAFRERVNTERGVIAAEVTTAVPLDAESTRLIAERLGRFLGHDPGKLNIRPRVDPAIIGGVIARVGDTLIDDSVRGRLERLRRALASPH
ncbi:MAG: F0F1 ATP synthase subunit delta [Chloroflexi bacterium]|nr:F0F1 ATP synthase subunit delta [Chloroflexota bacterium]